MAPLAAKGRILRRGKWRVASGEWRAPNFGMVDGEWTVTDRTCAPLPPPVFFVSADSKGFTWEVSVSADSAGVKVAVFSTSWE
jgi:hypothetical protein